MIGQPLGRTLVLPTILAAAHAAARRGLRAARCELLMRRLEVSLCAVKCLPLPLLQLAEPLSQVELVLLVGAAEGTDQRGRCRLLRRIRHTRVLSASVRRTAISLREALEVHRERLAQAGAEGLVGILQVALALVDLHLELLAPTLQLRARLLQPRDLRLGFQSLARRCAFSLSSLLSFSACARASR